MSEKNQPHRSDCFRLHKDLLTFSGLPVISNEQNFHKTYWIFMTIAIAINPIAEFTQIIQLQDDLDEFIKNFLFQIGFILVFLKIFLFGLERKGLLKILDDVQDGIFAPNIKRGGQTEVDLITNCVDYSRKQAIINTVLTALTVALNTAVVFIFKEKDEWKFPFGQLPKNNLPYGYEIALCYQLIAATTGTLIFTIMDVVYASILAHISVHCKLLQNYISKLITNSYTEMFKDKNPHTSYIPDLDFKVDPSNIEWKYLKQELRKAVLYHQAIIDIAIQTEDVFCIPLLIEFLGCSLCLCISMYNASLHAKLGFGIANDLVLIVCTLCPLSIVTYWGNEVMVESEAIADACNNLNFIGSDVRFQKALMVIIQRSQKPITLTVGKFAPMSLVTLVALLRASYSYFMFLRRVQED